MIVIMLIVVFARYCSYSRPSPKYTRHAGASGKMSSITRDQHSSCETRIKILIVHHGAEGDTFWQDVEKGFADAHNLLAGIDLTIVRGLGNMENGIRSALGNADGLCVTCPYVNKSNPESYAKIDEGIKAVIESGIPVITFNTDTYHNKQVFQYCFES